MGTGSPIDLPGLLPARTGQRTEEGGDPRRRRAVPAGCCRGRSPPLQAIRDRDRVGSALPRQHHRFQRPAPIPPRPRPGHRLRLLLPHRIRGDRARHRGDRPARQRTALRRRDGRHPERRAPRVARQAARRRRQLRHVLDRPEAPVSRAVWSSSRPTRRRPARPRSIRSATFSRRSGMPPGRSSRLPSRPRRGPTTRRWRHGCMPTRSRRSSDPSASPTPANGPRTGC